MKKKDALLVFLQETLDMKQYKPLCSKKFKRKKVFHHNNLISKHM